MSIKGELVHEIDNFDDKVPEKFTEKASAIKNIFSVSFEVL